MLELQTQKRKADLPAIGYGWMLQLVYTHFSPIPTFYTCYNHRAYAFTKKIAIESATLKPVKLYVSMCLKCYSLLLKHASLDVKIVPAHINILGLLSTWLI